MLFGEITREGKLRLNSGTVRCFASAMGGHLLAKTCEERTALRPNRYRLQLLLQLRALLFEHLLPCCRQFIQPTGVALPQVAKLVPGTFRPTLQRFECGLAFHLQSLMPPTRLREFRLVAEPQGCPVLAPDVAVRDFRVLPKRHAAARILCAINGLGQFVKRRQLYGLIGKAVRGNLRMVFFTAEHVTYEDPAVARRPSPLRASPPRLVFAGGGRPVIKRGTHGQPMREAGDDYGRGLRQVESSGDEVE
jgi:hypothetical protein